MSARTRSPSPSRPCPPGPTAVLVVDSQRHLEERAVTLGMETPARYEVLAGLKEGDLVMIGNPAQLSAGQQVDAAHHRAAGTRMSTA